MISLRLPGDTPREFYRVEEAVEFYRAWRSLVRRTRARAGKAAQARRKRQRRKAEGRCRDCGARALVTVSHCAACREKNNARAREGMARLYRRRTCDTATASPVPASGTDTKPCGRAT